MWMAALEEGARREAAGPRVGSQRRGPRPERHVQRPLAHELEDKKLAAEVSEWLLCVYVFPEEGVLLRACCCYAGVYSVFRFKNRKGLKLRIQHSPP